MSLCLQVWVSVKKMILHNDTKFCLRCMLKELKLRKAWQQLKWHWPQCFSTWELIKVPFKALVLLYCPVKFSGRTCLNVYAQGNSVERKDPLLPLWHNCSCEHDLCITPEFTQVSTRHWWAKAEHMPANRAVYPRFPVDSTIQPVLRIQLTSTYSMDAKDVLTEVLICGMRVNDSVGHPHFHPHANSPQRIRKQCRHRCHLLQSSHSNTMTWEHPSHF